MNHNKNLRVIAYVLLVCMLFTIFPGGAIAAITNSVDEVTLEVKRVFANAVDSTTTSGAQYSPSVISDEEPTNQNVGTRSTTISYDALAHTLTFTDVNAPWDTRRYDLHLWAGTDETTSGNSDKTQIAFIKAEWKAIDGQKDMTSGGVTLTTPDAYDFDFTIKGGQTFSATVNLKELAPYGTASYAALDSSKPHLWAQLWACNNGYHTDGTGTEPSDTTWVYLGEFDSWNDFVDKKYTVTTGSSITYYSDITKAVTAAKDGATITLYDDVTSKVVIPSDANITLDLNGYTIYQADNIDGIENNGILTVNDSSKPSKGQIIGSHGIWNKGTLTVNGGTITATGSDGILNQNSGTVTIEDGTIAGPHFAICDISGSNNTVNAVKGGHLVCTHKGNPDDADFQYGYVVGSYDNSTGGTWTFAAGVTMENKCGARWINTYENSNDKTANNNVVSITEGNTNVILVREDGIAEVVATSNVETKLKGLVGQTADIILFANVGSTDNRVSSGITIPAGVNVTFDLNGYTFAVDGKAVINNGNLTIEDSRTDGTINGSTHGINNCGMLTVNGGTIIGVSHEGICNVNNAKSITINGGHIIGANYAICDIALNSVNVINNGTLECTADKNDDAGYTVGSWNVNMGGIWAIETGVQMINTAQNATNGRWVHAAISKKEQNAQEVVLANSVTYTNATTENGKTTCTVQATVQGATLEEQLNNAVGNTAYIKLGADVTGTVTIPANATVVLDLNGNDINGGVINYGNLIIMDSSANGKGVISGAIGVINYNELTVNGGNILGNGYEGISNMTSAVSLDINGGTVAGSGYAVCDYGVNSTNTVTGGTLTCNDRTVGGGIGYVIGSFGGSKGGTWALGVGAKFVNKINDTQFINTDENGNATYNQQVAVANWNEVTIENGVVVKANSDNAAAQALKASKDNAEATVAAKAAEAKAAGADATEVQNIVDKANTAIGNATTAADVAAAVNEAITALEKLAVAAEAEAKTDILTAEDEKEIADLMDEVNSDDAFTADKATAKVRNILDKADLIAEINSNSGLSNSEKTDFVKEVEAVKAEAQNALDKAANEYVVDDIVAKANAKYEAIRMVADAYDDVTSAGEKALDSELAAALEAIDKADSLSAIQEALLDLSDKIDEIKAKYKPSSSGFSGTYNYAVSTPSVSNGSASLSDSYANAGETVVITVTPDNGYGVADVVVTDADGNEIAVTALGGGQYSFVMPEGKVNVDAVCKPAITLTIDKYEANVFGKIVKNDVVPMLVDNRTMLPIRFVAEALGADVAWDAAKQLVTIKNDDTVIKIYIGQKQAYVNGEAVELDAAAFIKNGRTYLPLRFVAEHLDADVHWDAVTKMVTVIPE